MKYKFIIVMLIGLLCCSAQAQKGNSTPKTFNKIEYHGGPVMRVSPDVYLIWYGGWLGTSPEYETQYIVADFASRIGGTSYFASNTAYSDSEGYSPTGAVFFGGASLDPEPPNGQRMTEADVQAIIAGRVASGNAPLDTAGVYIVIGRFGINAPDLGFCTQAYAPPAHGKVLINGTPIRYGFVGDPRQCPSLEAPQFVAPNGIDLLPTPNGNFAADAIVNKIAQVLNNVVTDPDDNAWYDRYGFEAGDKCWGLFGTTFTTANGARANVHFVTRDYLIQQNWVNDRRGRGYCTLSYP